MANLSYVLLFLSISQLAVAMAIPPFCLLNKCEKEMKMVVYLHDIHPSRPDHNLVVTDETSETHGFGSITVNDWAILDAPDPSGNLIANARGTGVNTDPQNGIVYENSFSILFTGSSFQGSTLQVMGVSTVGEWAIVGGTGELAFARGIIKYETVKNVPNVEYYLKLSIYALYTPPSVYGSYFP